MTKETRYKLFIKLVLEIGKVLNVSISHEDKHGAFIITDLNREDAIWFKQAFLEGVEE